MNHFRRMQCPKLPQQNAEMNHTSSVSSASHILATISQLGPAMTVAVVRLSCSSETTAGASEPEKREPFSAPIASIGRLFDVSTERTGRTDMAVRSARSHSVEVEDFQLPQRALTSQSSRA